jgi:hypothetical protein
MDNIKIALKTSKNPIKKYKKPPKNSKIVPKYTKNEKNTYKAKFRGIFG